MMTEYFNQCVQQDGHVNNQNKFILRIENIQGHLIPDDNLVSNKVAAKSIDNPLLPFSNVDKSLLKQTICPIRYREFKESFPLQVRKNLYETTHYLHSANKLSNPNIQTKLLSSMSKTIMFDLYNKTLAGFFQRPESPPFYCRPFCVGLKALYSRHSVNTMMDCKSYLGRNDIDIIHGDKINQLIHVSQFILHLPPLSSPPNNSFVIHDDPSNYLLHHVNLVELLRQRAMVKCNSLKQMIVSNEGCSLEKIPKENQIQALHKCGSLAVNVATAHLEYKMLEDLLLSKTDIIRQPILSRLVLLDTLVKIQDDLGWIVSNRLLSEEVSMAIPFLIYDLSHVLTPHILTLVDSFELQ
ncbi:hypothetical protein PPL_06124 [Heterostelium album PN500]|uniref:Acyl-CoA oxidase C-terminal domain-containing protein n=1 Tax=Heterostelium pallidum (strain ATCC 26659 / Pp 5 / PN500) TaxID=670386 RepID=D3BC99_HETP5|nr:hypothetical protein PPL_06124 [Heterostelium album PN500]EFA80889.1 hypothetical protein PPL_06124 [Heterostelium album PN500]|eukprot:XP_020433008.1 hypothetical protein PPL_06124 [Heterostelium album PN500]